MQRIHIYISGRVQGVTFRATTKQKAEKLGLSGWIKNLKDGRVEAVFEGDKNAIKNIVKYCHRGPRLANVEDIELSYEEPKELNDFTINK